MAFAMLPESKATCGDPSINMAFAMLLEPKESIPVASSPRADRQRPISAAACFVGCLASVFVRKWKSGDDCTPHAHRGTIELNKVKKKPCQSYNAACACGIMRVRGQRSAVGQGPRSDPL